MTDVRLVDAVLLRVREIGAGVLLASLELVHLAKARGEMRVAVGDAVLQVVLASDVDAALKQVDPPVVSPAITYELPIMFRASETVSRFRSARRALAPSLPPTPSALSRLSIRMNAWAPYAIASSRLSDSRSRTSIAARLASSASAFRPSTMYGVVRNKRFAPSPRPSPRSRQSAIACYAPRSPPRIVR